jgi:hypothetical protein
MAKIEAGYIIKTPVVITDARGALGLLRGLSYDEIIRKKDLKKYIRQSLNQAKREVQNAAKRNLPNDPRKSYQGVKVGIYKKTLGGNVSLFNQRSTGKKTSYELPKGGKSGIFRKRQRSTRTIQVDSYYGRDRAFILRMHNQGTGVRTAFTRTRSKSGKTANRGSLRALNFFSVADSAVRRSADTLSQKLEQAITEAGYGK